MADSWGTASHREGRCVWFDVGWEARGGPPPQAPGGHEAMTASIRMLRKAWPGTTAWWGHLTGTWRAALPSSAGGQALVRAPTRDGLIARIAGAYQAPQPARLAAPA
jgi:hypothetical protein